MKWLTIISLLLPHFGLGQQNLVSNGSFEEYSACPVSAGQGSWALSWTVPNAGSPDFYQYCSESDHLVPPEIVFGYEYPHTGEGFIGIYPFVLHELDQGEYIQTRLTEPIYPGVRYKVSFYVSLAELSLYAVSSLGAYFSVEQIQSSGFDVFDVEPQVQNPSGNILADTSGWVLITDTFVSRTGGGEEWLTIGNFNYAAESDTFAFQSPNPDMGNFFFSYYYIDDVSVVALDSVPNSVSETEKIGLTVYPNPSSQFVEVHAQLPIYSIRLFDLRGREVFITSNAGGRKYSLDVSGLPAGMYLLEAKDKTGRRATERIVKTDGP